MDSLIGTNTNHAVLDDLQKIASQQEPNTLLEIFIHIALKHSGAERGSVLLIEGDAMLLKAVGHRGHGGIAVDFLCERDFQSFCISEEILQKATEKHDLKVLSGLQTSTPLCEDELFLHETRKPVACLPLIKGVELLGFLYLECSQIEPNFFTQTLPLLGLFSTHATIAMANIRVQEHLRCENSRLQALSKELVLQRYLLRALAESFPHRIYAKDRQTRFIFANMGVARGMGVECPDDLLGKTDFGFYPKEAASQYFQEEQDIMQSGQAMMHHEEKVNYILTNDVSWMLTTKFPLKDDAGDVIGIIGVNYDISDRKKMELELLNQNAELLELNKKLSQARVQLEQSEKLAAIGQLAAGVAHEINNPIGYIFSNIGTLGGYVDSLFRLIKSYEKIETSIGHSVELNEVKNISNEIDILFLKEDIPILMAETKEGIARVRTIVQSLKDFSRTDTHQEWQWANLHQGIDATLNIINSEIKYKADIVKNYGELPEVECFPSQINQVVMNLLVNAAHSIGDNRGEISIKTSRLGDEVVIAISDTGCGISKENMSRIFDPFFTTKPIGQGTGLGLSLSYGIAEKHGGKLSVQSEVGKGSTFSLSLPIAQVKTQLISPSPSSE